MEKVVIIEYGAGNLFSVETAVRRLGYEVACSADADVIRAADKVIFPGVGCCRDAAIERGWTGYGNIIIAGTGAGDMFGDAIDV